MDLLYLRNKKCAAVRCTSVSAEHKFFKFPREPERYRQWAAVAKNPKLDGRAAFLCSRHFDGRQFKDPFRTLLIKGATPSICWPPEVLPMSSQNLPTVPEALPLQPEVLLVEVEEASCVSFPPEDLPTDVSSCNIHFESDFSKIVTSTPCPAPPCPAELPHADLAIPSTSADSSKPSCSLQLSFSEKSTSCVNVAEASTSTAAEEILPCVEDVLSVEGQLEVPQKLSAPGKKRKSMLAKMSLTRKNQLTPRKKLLLEYYEKNVRSLRSTRKKYQDAKATISRLTDAINDPAKVVELLSQSMSLATAQFVASQIRCGMTKPKGRRWTEQDKVLALSIYKRSPKAYTLLQGIFALPSKRTLIKIVNSVPFNVGIDDRVFASLRHTLAGMTERDRVCSLMFDEMSLREHLQYDIRADRVTGFQDLGGSQRSELVANQALVVMLQGLHRKWRQPVAYYVTRGGMGAEAIVKILRNLLTACENSGLNVVCIVCDMGTKNVRALKLLGSSVSQPFFIHSEKTIYTLFDPPHLLKCLRNMLFRNDVAFDLDIAESKVNGKAMWQHICQAYAVDRMQPCFRHLRKVTAQHLKPVGYAAMRVSFATQVLSHSMAATITGFVSSGALPSAANYTAHYAGFADKLFDSFNGRFAQPAGAEGLKCQLRLERENLHLDFWREASTEIRSWKFMRRRKPVGNATNVFRPPCQAGWLRTLKGIANLWSHLKDLGFSFIETRALNQDPLEHLFGSIRQQCGCNTNPTVPQFQSALKACIINGMAFKDIIGSNCEDETDTVNLLSNLNEYLKAPAPLPEGSDDFHSLNETTVPKKEFDPESETFSLAYVAGYIARRCLKGSRCNNCNNALTTNTADPGLHLGIIFKEYSSKNSGLTYPTPDLVKCVGMASTMLEEMMESQPHSDHLRRQLVAAMIEGIDMQWLVEGCREHFPSITEMIFNGVCLISLPWWCKRKNRDISQRNRERAAARKMKILQHV